METNTEKKGNETIEKVNWKNEALKGNFMPAVIMLEQNKINVNDIVEENNKETLLHLAGRYTFYNVIRVLIEKFHADLNIKNKNGHTLLYLIVSTTNYNIINFVYLIRQKNLEIDIYDNNGMSPLVHSIITCFHYAFLFFVNEGLLEKHKDNYGNPITYFPIANNNKFVLTYFLLNKKYDINANFFNNTQSLGDLLITNPYNSITKLLAKYFGNKLDLNSIISCRKNILDFQIYNVYNYEILNTLYYYKTKDYFGFFSALLKTSILNNLQAQNNQNNNNDKKDNNFGYYYKYINFRFMIYNLILPSLSLLYKLLLFFIYMSALYFICNEKNNELNPNPRSSNYIYNSLSFICFYIILLILFNSKKQMDESSKKKNKLESEISTYLKNNKIEDLPDIEEICSSCASIKKITTYHCYSCEACIKFRIFHSNLFGCCITKANIIYYLLYIILKINIYYICLLNVLKANPTNNGLICVFFPFWHKTSIKTFVLQNILAGLIVISFGHLINLLFCLSVKTPYKYIYGMDKRVYYKCLKENTNNKLIVQIPEINEEKKIKNIFSYLFKKE